MKQMMYKMIHVEFCMLSFVYYRDKLSYRYKNIMIINTVVNHYLTPLIISLACSWVM